MDRSNDVELAFSAEAFTPIEQHVLNERARTSVQPSTGASAGEQEVANGAPPRTEDDDREFALMCAIALQMAATLLERQMSNEQAERGGELLVRVLKKYIPDMQVGPELAMLVWAGSWYVTAPPLPKPSNPNESTKDGKDAQPS